MLLFEHKLRNITVLCFNQLEVADIPRQKNIYDCGVFTLRYAESITAASSIYRTSCRSSQIFAAIRALLYHPVKTPK